MLFSALYRVLASALLLVLYAFIAMPVQVWHIHAGITANGIQSAAHPQKSYSTSPCYAEGTAASVTDDCKICAHHYSAYCDEDETFTVALFQCISSVRSSFIASLTDAGQFLFSNKGPPFSI